jgi:chromosome transmission fidelity protein 8
MLFGVVQKLDKPFAVLEKARLDDERKTEYLVKAVIKRKLCFKDRPKPIVGASITTTSTTDA